MPALSAAGGTGTFGISAGVAPDLTNGYAMRLASAYTKTTSAWAVGSATGSLDTGAIANSTWYHVYLIRRPDTGVVDVIISTSAGSPTLPANYTQYRRIGAMLTNSSAQWAKFTQDGDTFLWDVPTLSVNNQPVDTVTRTYTMGTPVGIKTDALINVLIFASSAAGMVVSSPNTAVQAVGTPTGNSNINCASGSIQTAAQMRIQTDTSALVRFVASLANVSLYVTTIGWVDRRGRG